VIFSPRSSVFEAHFQEPSTLRKVKIAILRKVKIATLWNVKKRLTLLKMGGIPSTVFTYNKQRMLWNTTWEAIDQYKPMHVVNVQCKMGDSMCAGVWSWNVLVIVRSLDVKKSQFSFLKLQQAQTLTCTVLWQCFYNQWKTWKATTMVQSCLLLKKLQIILKT